MNFIIQFLLSGGQLLAENGTSDTGGKPGVTETTVDIPIFELVLQGGWYIMIPMAVMSVLAVFIFVERFMAIQKATKGEKDLMMRVRQYIHEGKLDQAKDICRQSQNPVARMLEKGISKIGKPMKDINQSIENVGRIEIQKLEKRLSTLATIAGAAPMLGFLGTTIGMISAFHEMKALTSLSLDKIAPGMMQAMVTTVAGLIVGIIAYVAYNYLVSKVEKVVHQMEGSSLEFIDLLDEPGN